LRREKIENAFTREGDFSQRAANYFSMWNKWTSSVRAAGVKRERMRGRDEKFYR
jgi:hypothetical protein